MKITNFDSWEEELFYQWLLELEQAGYISNIKRAPTFKLADSYDPYGILLLEDIHYTPDFVCKVIKEGNLFQPVSKPRVSIKKRKEYALTYNDSDYAYFEVKPVRDVRGKTREVNIKRKWLFEKHSVFVELVKLPGSSNKGVHLFSKTFTPNSYKLTKTGKKRKINYKLKTLKEYENLSTMVNK